VSAYRASWYLDDPDVKAAIAANPDALVSTMKRRMVPLRLVVAPIDVIETEEKENAR